MWELLGKIISTNCKILTLKFITNQKIMMYVYNKMNKV